MKTTSYDKILFRAAELAKRTRDKIPLSEEQMLRGFMAEELKEMWTRAPWPDLVPDPESVPVTGGDFSKREGLPNEMGDVLGVFSRNPKATTKYVHIRFQEGDNVVRVRSALANVWVEYMRPAADLLSVPVADLPGFEIPSRFSNPLSFKAAGHILGADGEDDAGNKMLMMGEKAIERESARIVEPPWRTQPRTYEEMSQMVAVPTAGERTGQRYTGFYPLNTGREDGAVTGLGLAWTPTASNLWIVRPLDQLNLNAWLVAGSLTGDGFQFQLDGVTDGPDYVLWYELWN